MAIDAVTDTSPMYPLQDLLSYHPNLTLLAAQFAPTTDAHEPHSLLLQQMPMSQ